MEKELIRSVQQFHSKFGLNKANQSEALWLCMLMEEVGELTKSVLRDDPPQQIESECGDILYVLQGFCELFGYDLWSGVQGTMRKNDLKTPATNAKSSSGKVVGGSSANE